MLILRGVHEPVSLGSACQGTFKISVLYFLSSFLSFFRVPSRLFFSFFLSTCGYTLVALVFLTSCVWCISPAYISYRCSRLFVIHVMDWPSWHDQAVPFRAACRVTENCQESRLNETDWLDQTNSNDQDIKENMSFEKERKRKKNRDLLVKPR